MDIFVTRLLPNQDIKKNLSCFLAENNLSAAAIVSAVGSVKEYALRVSDGISVIRAVENREIVSLSGILTKDGVHLHISLSGINGQVIGGHLMEGCLVNTTLEIVLISLDNFKLSRELDTVTGFKELVIK